MGKKMFTHRKQQVCQLFFIQIILIVVMSVLMLYGPEANANLLKNHTGEHSWKHVKEPDTDPLRIYPKFHENQENWNSELLYNIDKRIEDVESKLSECHKECEYTELKVHEATQLKDKGTFVLKMVKRRYDNLNDELREIHFNYAKCSEKNNSNKENVQQNINSLTMQRNHLRKELEELKKIADENKVKLMEIKKMITIEEKKNMALMRKLKRMTKNMHITPDLKDRINAILNDPRLTNI